MIVSITYLHKNFITDITLKLYGINNFILKYECIKI